MASDTLTLNKLLFDGLQYYSHSGDVACLLAPQRMLLGLHNANGDTCLHTALMAKNTTVALALMRVALPQDLDVVNTDGQAPLHLAVQLGMTEVIASLVSRGANVHVADGAGNTPAHHLTTAIDTTALFSTLSSDKRTRLLSAPNFGGLLPIHVAVRTQRLDVVSTLLGSPINADPNSADYARARTPLHHAVQTNCLPMVELLLQHGARTSPADTNANTPLHMALQHNRSSLVRLLVEAGADVSALNEYFQTPLETGLFYASDESVASLFVHPPPTTSAPATTPTPVAPAIVAPVRTIEAETERATLPPSYGSVSGVSAEDEGDDGHEREPEDWQVLDSDEVEGGGAEEWRFKNKNKTSTMDRLVRKVLHNTPSEKKEKAKKRDSDTKTKEKEKEKDKSSAKLEKARLAGLYGTPRDVVVEGPKTSAREEKEALRAKYTPTGVDVVDDSSDPTVAKGRRTSSDVATTKAAEAQAQHRSHPQTHLTDLSSID